MNAVRGKNRPERRICFYSLHVISLYMEGRKGIVGGAEVQYDLLSRLLADRFDVHMVSLAPLQGSTLKVPEGITLHVLEDSYDTPTVRRSVSFPPRSMRLWPILARVDADLYLQRGAGFVTFLVSLFCKVRGLPFVFHWASEKDLLGDDVMPALRPLYRRGRKWAALQVCQNERQFELLPAAERKRAVIVPNALDPGPRWRPSDGAEVLWVGSVKPEAKKPERFLDLAQALPHRRFRIVGDLRGDAVFKAEFHRRLATLPNLSWAGFTERDALPGEYARGRCLVNTSDVEGFPNTFLEACASGVPIVSLNVDPNGMLERDGVGVFLRGDLATMASAVESMFDDATWSARRVAALRVAERHAPEALAARLGDLLDGLIAPASD